MSCKLYLISPPQIELPRFADSLKNAFDGGEVAVFQLRLEDASDKEIIAASEELQPICAEHNVVFLLNNRADLVEKTGADGMHLGKDDMSVSQARKIFGDSIVIGASCYDSTDLAMQCAEDGADYIAFGSFFPSPTKSNPARPSLEQLADWSFASNVPAVAIGGITHENCLPLIENGADFLAVISAVWQHKDGPAAAVKRFNEIMHKAVPIEQE